MHGCVRPSVLLFLVVQLTGACNNSDAITTPTPPPTVTDVLTGTLTTNGAATHPFAVSTAGTVSVTLTTLSPDSTLVVGLALGTWNGAYCQIVLPNDSATQGSIVVGTIARSGNLCVRVYDVGNVIRPQSYEVAVTHP